MYYLCVCVYSSCYTVVKFILWFIPKETDPPGDSSRESGSNQEDILEKPNQPDPNNIPAQQLLNRIVHFQASRYKQYPWLHYSSSIKCVLCFHCVKTYTVKKSELSKKADPAFSSKGFNNWKNALASFQRHPNSKSHYHAIAVSAQERSPID